MEARELADAPVAVSRALTDPDGLGTQVPKPLSELSEVSLTTARATIIDSDEVVLSTGSV